MTYYNLNKTANTFFITMIKDVDIYLSHRYHHGYSMKYSMYLLFYKNAIKGTYSTVA
jgi:hypothetical protein